MRSMTNTGEKTGFQFEIEAELIPDGRDDSSPCASSCAHSRSML